MSRIQKILLYTILAKTRNPIHAKRIACSEIKKKIKYNGRLTVQWIAPCPWGFVVIASKPYPNPRPVYAPVRKR